jgi:hypothetical protein
MAASWSDIDAWTGSITYAARRQYTDADGWKRLNQLRVVSTVLLKKLGMYWWIGDETATATVIRTSYFKNPNGWNRIYRSGVGTFNLPYIMQFGIDANGKPINYNVGGLSGEVPASAMSSYAQTVKPTSSHSEVTLDAHEPVNRASIFSHPLPDDVRDLSGSRKAIDAGDYGTGTLSWRFAPSGTIQPRIVKFWVRAFVPFTLGSIMQFILSGKYRGRTAISGYSNSSEVLYLTDQRGFTPRLNVDSRLFTVFDIDVRPERERFAGTSFFGAGSVTQVSTDGNVDCGPKSP